MNFTKSLKFKLTIWYSLILSVFCIAFVFSINVWLTNYMNTWHTGGMGRGFLVERSDRPRWRALSEDQRSLVMESRLEDLNNIRRISIYMIFPMILLSFVGGYVIAGIMLRPLDKLNNEIKRKETSNLGEEIEFKDNGDEISQLIKSFNRMSRRLGKSFESQKQFVENASHELRTPLSVIQANLETLLEDRRITKKELEKLLFNSKNQVGVMDKLTEDLLLLSMISSGVSLEKEGIDMNSLVDKVVKDFKDRAKEKGIDIVWKRSKGKLEVKGNSLLLERALSNLLDNSIKYSKGSKIVLRIEKSKGKLIVEDNGKGIPRDKQELVFERFYRVDKGRSRKEGGTGLGLSIAKDIMNMHNGSIYIDSKYKNGVRFVMDFKNS